MVAEDEDGFVVDHQVNRGNPADAPQLVPSVERVTTLTGRVPATVVADRGFGTAGNDRALAELGFRRIGLQRTGTLGKARREYERSRPFRRMRNWRVGIEARISHLKRTFGFRRTRLRRLAGAQTWAGLGIFACNLHRMTVLGSQGQVARRPALSRPAAARPRPQPPETTAPMPRGVGRGGQAASAAASLPDVSEP